MTRSAHTSLLFRLVYARARPCYCYGCIVRTPGERAYERRLFRLARTWGQETKAVRASGPSPSRN